MATWWHNSFWRFLIAGLPAEFSESCGAGVTGVSQDEDPFALVWCADFSRAEYAPRCSVTHFFQVADDCGESQRYVAFDVFAEHPSGSAKLNSPCDVGPQVTGIVCPLSPSGCAEWLARVARSEEVHASTKVCVREGLNVREDRCRIQGTRFHLCDQVRAGESFPLHVSDCSQMKPQSLESQFNPSVSGAETEHVDGIIHIAPPPESQQQLRYRFHHRPAQPLALGSRHPNGRLLTSERTRPRAS